MLLGILLLVFGFLLLILILPQVLILGHGAGSVDTPS